MIYVNQKQLEQVEYLIEQSTRGHHVLFENDMIRRAFEIESRIPKRKQLSPDKEKKQDEIIEKHIESLILQPSLLAKRAYLENLEPEIFSRVVRTYFSIVENNIFEKNSQSH